MLLASLINVAENIGYPFIFLLIVGESAGVPIPGETALITGALLASHHKLSIVAVIALAAAGANVGGNLGYLIGHRAGRWLLVRPGRFAAQRREVLEIGEPFFERHGPSAVFFSRWILGLRTWGSWLAGVSQMRWITFAVWNGAGGIGWATSIGLLSYFLGSQFEGIFELIGVFGLITIVLVAIGLYGLHRQHRRQLASGASSQSDRPG